MPATLKFKFSHHFPGTIWNLLTVPEAGLLVIEVRDGLNFKVSFTALNYLTNEFIWRDWSLKEDWWIGLTAANEHTLLFHSFIDKGNPDHKNLLAYNILDQKIRWEIEEFSFFDWNEKVVWGYRTKAEITPAVVDLESGLITEEKWEIKGDRNRNDVILKPTPYLEGAPHFNTIKEFVAGKLGWKISMGAEYLEWNNLILISEYHEEEEGLANYLLVFDQQGDMVLKEKLGGKLQGLGVDTFFILAGCLFFVKNRLELVAYTYYD